MDIEKVKPLSNKEALSQHGDTGSLVVRVVKLNRIIILISLILALGIGVLSTAFILKPDNIITIDPSGRIIGNIQPMNDGSAREQGEVLSASLRFIECFINHNASTALYDKFCALNMMDTALREHWKAIWLSTNTVRTIQKAGFRCVVLIDDKGKIFKRTENEQYYSFVKGLLKCNNLDVTKTEKFALEFSAIPVQRTVNNPAGISVVSLFEDPFVNRNKEEKNNEKS
ncbi:MAG: hypothetical protein OEZ01_15280 [Candidatus Heimdallarchaeota archaeon]|nr:hypothetical protein [Candidatus Heimdallarchaeota archaeon]